MPCSAFKNPSRNAGKSVSFASPLEEHHFMQSDRGANSPVETINTMKSATYQRNTVTTTDPPPHHDIVRLTFVDGSPEGSEIQLNAKRNQPLFETLEAYRDLTDRDWEILRFVYNGIKFSATDTPAELHMSKHVWVDVYPHVEVKESDNEMDEVLNEGEEEEEEETFTPLDGAKLESMPLQPVEEGIVITDQSRIVSILEHALSNRTARLIATTDTAGSIVLCLSTEDTSMSVPNIAVATPDTSSSGRAKPEIERPASAPHPTPQRRAAGRSRDRSRGRIAQKAPRSQVDAKIRGSGNKGKGIREGRVGKSVRAGRGGSKR